MEDPAVFFSAAASLIPVLVLVEVVEISRDRERLAGRGRRALEIRLLGVVGFFWIAVSGEAIALHALLRGPGEQSAYWVSSTILVMISLLVYGAVAPFLDALEATGVNRAGWVGGVTWVTLTTMGIVLLALLLA